MMSTDTYAACRTCKTVLCIDKLFLYEADDDAYRTSEKLKSLQEWLKVHAWHNIAIFTEHDAQWEEIHAEGWTSKWWPDGELEHYRPPPGRMLTAWCPEKQPIAESEPILAMSTAALDWPSIQARWLAAMQRSEPQCCHRRFDADPRSNAIVRDGPAIDAIGKQGSVIIRVHGRCACATCGQMIGPFVIYERHTHEDVVANINGWVRNV